MRRHILTFFTMLALIALVAFGASWGWRSLTADLPDSPLVAEEPTPSCKPIQLKPGQKLRAKQVQVSVFNGGSRSGLAGETLDALIERGFIGGELGNAPSDLNVVRVQVWTTVKNDPQARLVARQLGSSVNIRHTRKDLGEGVDVIVGNAFTKLRKPAPKAIPVRKPLELCVPVPETVEPAD